jgi:hypothetical protein
MAGGGRATPAASWRKRRLVALAAASMLAGCAPLVRYTDALVDASTGRTAVTRMPATFGGILGFAAGIPLDVAALPVTYTVYASQEPGTADVTSIFLFPSFVLWRVGACLGAPFDFVEWACWRVWRGEDSISSEERERRERELDQLDWDDYPVRPIYPLHGVDAGTPPAKSR